MMPFDVVEADADLALDVDRQEIDHRVGQRVDVVDVAFARQLALVLHPGKAFPGAEIGEVDAMLDDHRLRRDLRRGLGKLAGEDAVGGARLVDDQKHDRPVRETVGQRLHLLLRGGGPPPRPPRQSRRRRPRSESTA